MGRTLEQKLAELSETRRAKIETRAAELIDEELSLQALRKAHDRTQAEVAELMGVGQDTVSRYEQRADLMLSTLERYVGAMGGELMLIARFPDRKPVRIRTFAELNDERAQAAPASMLKRRAEKSRRPGKPAARRSSAVPAQPVRRD